MKGFIVEPGSKVSVSARLRSCAPVRLLPLGRRRSSGSWPAPAPRRSARRARPRCRPWPCARRPRRGCAGRRRTAPSSRSTARCRGRRPARRCSPTSSTTRPSRSLMTRRVPSRPASSFWKASSMPSWPLVLDVGEADHVRRRLAFGVLALVFAHLVDALDAERLAPAARRGSSTWRRSQTKFGLSSSRALELGAASCRAARASRARCARVAFEVLRDRPDRRRRHARGEDQAVAVDDAAAARRQLQRVARSGSRPASGRTARRRSARRRRGRAARAKPRPTSATSSFERHGGVCDASSGLVE